MEIALKIIKTRTLQFARIIQQLGWLYALIVAFVSLFIIYVIFGAAPNKNTAYVITGISAFLIFSIHTGRADKLFIMGITDKPYQVYLCEYFILELLPIAYLLIGRFYELVAFLALLPFVLGFLPLSFFYKQRKKTFKSWPIASQDFEWISGLRRSYMVLLFIYLLAIISLSVPFLSLLFVWYLALSLCSFYKESEPLQILLASEQTVNGFLISKVWAHQKNYWKFVLPIVFIYGIMYQEHLIIVVLFVLFVMIGLAFAVINKYSNYTPGEYTGNDLLNTLVFGAVLIPFLAPLPIVLLLRSTIKARKNLRYYFED
mgnify:CR=1 FL=1